MKLRYTRAALRQIHEVLLHVGDRSPQGAARIGERILAVTALIRDHPRAAQATSRPGIRRMVLAPYPYVLSYRVGADEVIVTRFRHAARRPLSGTGRT